MNVAFAVVAASIAEVLVRAVNVLVDMVVVIDVVPVVRLVVVVGVVVVAMLAHTVEETDPEDSENISLSMNRLTVSDSTQCTPQSVCSKAFALRNMKFISVTRATFHVEISTLKDTAFWNIAFMFVTRATSHLEMSLSKEVAPLNIPCMSVTDETSHLEMSALKKGASLKIAYMSVIRDTSHSPIDPCSPLAQLPSDEKLRHFSIAWPRTHLSSGENNWVSVVCDDCVIC